MPFLFFASTKKPMHLFHVGGSSKKLISFLAQFIGFIVRFQGN
jgi:hypothetical protein